MILLLNNLRDSLQPHLEKIGKSFASTGVSPNGWSCIGLGFAFASAFVYGWNIEYSLIIGGVIPVSYTHLTLPTKA